MMMSTEPHYRLRYRNKKIVENIINAGHLGRQNPITDCGIVTFSFYKEDVIMNIGRQNPITDCGIVTFSSL